MSGSLRLRIVILCVIVALLTAALGLWSSARILVAQVDAERSVRRSQVQGHLIRAESRLTEQLVHDIRAYAQWDQLVHDQVPTESAARAAVFRDSLTCNLALIINGRLTARIHPNRLPDGAVGDSVPDDELFTLVTARPGLAVIGGRVVLVATEPIAPSELLLGYRFCDAGLLEGLSPSGCDLTLASEPSADLHSMATLPGADVFAMREVRAVPGGTLAITVLPNDGFSPRIHQSVITGALLAGAVGVIAACLLGILLGWHWTAPLHRLAAACRHRRAAAIFDGSGLRETEILADELSQMVEGERQARMQLQAALERLRSVHMMHGRFAERLVIELAGPLRVLDGMVSRLRSGERCDLAELAVAEEALSRIEGRLAESEAISQVEQSADALQVSVHLPTWISGVIGNFSVQAAARHLACVMDAVDVQIRLPVRQLMPMLVHLFANAVQAAPAHSTVSLQATVADGHLRIVIRDAGPGLPEELRQRLQAAHARGEVLPGEPGIGFGLSLVIERCALLGANLEYTPIAPSGTGVSLTVPCITPE